MDLKFETEATFLNEDHSWLASRKGFGTARPATLDLSLFTPATHFPNGFIPSGMSLARVTAAGANQNMYGPYAANVSEVQTFTRTSTGGTITVAFDGSPVSGTIPATAAGFTAAALQAALESLSTINPGDVVVTGPAGGPLVVTFQGRYLGQNVPAIVVDNALATGGTITVATTTGGGSALTNGQQNGSGLLLASSVVRPTNTTGKIVVPLLWEGIVRQSKLPANHGVDAAFRQMVNTIRWEA